MYRTKCLKKIGGFSDIIAGQEYMLMLKTINAKLRLGYIPQALVAVYIHAGERVSTGLKKLQAQKIIIKEKKKYFNYLTIKQKRYVLCRHYGVLFYIQLNRRKLLVALWCALLAFIHSPSATYELYRTYKGKLKQI